MSNSQQVQPTRTIGTFYEGILPQNVPATFIFREESALVTLPLVLGTTTQIISTPLQVSAYEAWLINHVEFFMTVPVGGLWVETPTDFARNSLFFDLLIDGRSPWAANGVFQPPPPALPTTFNGVDILGQNIMARFSTRPTALVVLENSIFTAHYTVVNVALPVPPKAQVGIRMGGVSIPLNEYRRWAK